MLTQKLPPKKLPLGIEDFNKLVASTNNYLYVDKTLMIKEFIESGAEVSLILRPRRWGKTLNMSMLRHFFAPEVNGQATKEIFKHCKISKDTEVMQHQGKYPVIFFTLKNIKADSLENAIEKFRVSIHEIYVGYSKIFSESSNLLDSDKKEFERIRDNPKSLDVSELQSSLLVLSRLLYTHYNKKVFILIDEYDTPLNYSYQHKYLDKLTEFMKFFLGTTLKGNDYLEKGLMTGILRLSKNNMLSDLNNPEIYSMFNEAYSSCFGFSEDEVSALFKQQNLEMTEDVKNWYNGYPSGKNLQVYNPVSIIKCIHENGKLEPYWLLTADDSFIREMLLTASSDTKLKFEKLLVNQPIEGSISDRVTYEDLNKNEFSLWSILLASGYLKAVKWKREGLDYTCTLQIPNNEVLCIYTTTFKDYLSEKIGIDKYEIFLKSLVQGNVEKFTEALGDYLLRSASIFETGDKKGEIFYHGFSLGLISSLPESKYHVRSNRESGLGRYDVCIIPKLSQDGKIGIILEFKHAKSNKNTEIEAEGALKQIQTRHYKTEIEGYNHIEKIIQIGLAFSGKSVVSAYEEIDIKTQAKTPMKMTYYSSPDNSQIYDSDDNFSPIKFSDKPSGNSESQKKSPSNNPLKRKADDEDKNKRPLQKVHLNDLNMSFSGDESPSKSEKNKKYSDFYLTLLREALLYGDDIINFIQETGDTFTNTNAQLRKQASNYGYTCVDVEAKGNCFYLAVAHQLNLVLKLGHDSEKIKLLASCLRNLACEHIQKHAEVYEGFLNSSELKSQALDKVWVEEAVITALCYSLNVNIILIRHDGSEPTIKKLNKGTCTLVLGYQVGLHYQSLHPNNTADPHTLSPLLQQKFNDKDIDELKVQVTISTDIELQAMLERLLKIGETKLQVSKVLYNELTESTVILGEKEALDRAILESLESCNDESSTFKKEVESFLQDYENSRKPVFTFSSPKGSELIIRFRDVDENQPIKANVQESLKQLAEFLKSELGVVTENPRFFRIIINLKGLICNNPHLLSCSSNNLLTIKSISK